MTFLGVAFDIHAYNDPNGAALVRLTPSETVRLSFRLAEQGYSMTDGLIEIHTDHADATAANFHKHNLVKPVLLFDSGEVPVPSGFFLEEGDFTALSTAEQGGRVLTFTGPNTLYYAARGMLRETAFSEEPGASTPIRGSFDVDGRWYWTTEPPGAWLTRALEEGFWQPGPGGTSADAPLADATWDFDRDEDSDGTAWPDEHATYEFPWGTSTLDVLNAAVKAGIHVRVGPDLDFHAYLADPGVDRTSLTFAANKVRFEAGVNIATQLRRKIAASRERTAVLVDGADGVTAYVDGGSGDVTWLGHVAANETTDPTALEDIGQHDLDAREIQTESGQPVKHIVADDELNGGYVPFRDYVPGDIVTLHTGTGDHDFDDFAIPVAALSLIHDSAGNWFGVAELGGPYLSAESRAFEERAATIIRQAQAHSHPELLCRAGSGDTTLYNITFPGAAEQTVAVYPSGTGTWPVNPSAVLSGNGPDGNPGIGDFDVAGADGGSPKLPAVVGVTYRWTAWVQSDCDYGSPTTALFVGFYESDDSLITSHVLALFPAPDDGAWYEWSEELTAPTGTAYMRLVLGATAGCSAGYDNVLVEAIGGPEGDGHADLVGTGTRMARCGHAHHVLRDSAPTVNDDTDDGYPVTTLWTQVDDLETPTAIVGTWLLLDGGTGAAVWEPFGGGPDLSGINYLVGTASGDLSAEIVVGTTPGGELGGTWASPTVDTTHSGSAHADAIAKAIVDAKGDIIAATAADTVARLAVGTNGHVLTADSAQSTGIKWAAAAGISDDLRQLIVSWGGFREYVAGRYYTGAVDGGALLNSSGVPTAGQLFFMPLYIVETRTFDRIALHVSTGVASSTARMGIYDSDANGLPDALILDAGTVACDTTGGKEITISQSLTGDVLYWFALEASSATLRFASHIAAQGSHGRSTLALTAAPSVYTVAHVYGALPNPAGSVTHVDAANMQFALQLRA